MRHLKKLKSNRAFTLIEISIVLVIISLLMGIISQTSGFIKKSLLAKVQTLTKNSPVLDIDDLEIWFETSLKSSFDERISDGDLIVTWYNQNKKSYIKSNAIQTSNNNKPTYREDFFNGIPTVDFDGGNDFMPFNGTSIVYSDYTIFIVGSRSSINGGDYFIGANGSGAGQVLHLGYRNNALTITQGHWYSDMNYTPDPPLEINRLYIYGFYFSQQYGKKMYLNGDLKITNSNQKTPLVANNSSIGKIHYDNGPNNNCHCAISEIIIFSRALKDKEIKSINDYLTEKHNILPI